MSEELWEKQILDLLKREEFGRLLSLEYRSIKCENTFYPITSEALIFREKPRIFIYEPFGIVPFICILYPFFLL